LPDTTLCANNFWGMYVYAIGMMELAGSYFSHNFKSVAFGM
jgi:hypothetical protein